MATITLFPAPKRRSRLLKRWRRSSIAFCNARFQLAIAIAVPAALMR
ncbi:MAG: hypothetical protein R3C40_05055 [Parvularculaceae bacterium]